MEFKDELNEFQRKRLNKIISSYPMVLTKRPGRATNYECKIILKDLELARKGPYFLPPDRLPLLEEHINESVDSGILLPCQSSYVSPVFFVAKHSGGVRLCADYRFLNTKIQFDPFSACKMNTIFNSLGSAKYFSVSDLNKSFYQIPLSQDSRHITAIITQVGQHAFSDLPLAW